MNFNKKIKSDALLSLKGNWIKAIFITSIWSMIVLLSIVMEMFLYKITGINYLDTVDIINSLIFSVNEKFTLSASFIMFVVSIFLLDIFFCSIFSVLRNGSAFWDYNVITSRDSDFGNIFYYFSSLRKILHSLHLSLQLFVRKIIWSVFIFLPAIIVGSWSVLATVYQSRLTYKFLIPFGYILTNCLAVIGIIICILFFRRYSLTRYLIVSGECEKVRQAIKMSIKIMKGKKIEYLKLIMSFLGWFIASIAIFPMFFSLPYFKVSLALYSRYLVEGYNIEQNKNEIEEILINDEIEKE